MTVKIETYRGWEILFDTDEETFFVESDDWDQREKKRSFAACKTFVDDYIKENKTFKPIRVQHKTAGTELILTGIRKDGRFTYEKNGKKEQLSDFDVADYVKYDPENVPLFKRREALLAEAQKLREEAGKIREFITGTPLSEIKKDLAI